MSLFIVDQQKCRRDGICVDECPARIIEMSAQEGFPAPTEFADKLCIQCGHCVSVCPEGALSLQIMGPEECSPVPKGFQVAPTQMEHLIYTRRSTRTYKKKGLGRRMLKRLINIARYAPSVKNLQLVHWLVIEKRSEVNRLASLVVDWLKSMLEEDQKPRYSPLAIRQIAERWQKGDDLICHGAPHVIVVHGPKDSRASLTSCVIALTTLDLAAHSFGLGTCWAGYFYAAANSYPPMFKALGIPNDHQCFGAVMLGNPKYRYYRIPVKKEASITWR